MRLVNAGGKTGGRHVVAQNSPIHHLREERDLRDEFAHQMRDVFLTFRRKSLLIACSAAKRDDHNFSFWRGEASARAHA